jgi:glucose/arabinose dehydrogenase
MTRPLTLFALASAALASPAIGQIQIIEVADNFTAPTAIEQAPGDSARLFVAEKHGRIRIIENGNVLPTPFLNLVARVESSAQSGLLGMTLHPDHVNNGKMYVFYVTPEPTSIVLQEYVASANPNVALPTHTQELLSIPINNIHGVHHGGCLDFGLDGMLYVSMGDVVIQENGQDASSPHGKILRFDVDNAPSFIPADNPFVGAPGFDPAVYDMGLRQPWRFSVDRLTGDLWIGDVGNTTEEEINVSPAVDGGGHNFGWPCWEGSLCTGVLACTCGDPGLTIALHSMPHDAVTHAVIGGYVYRGTTIPELMGRYIFADWITGDIKSLGFSGGVVTDVINHDPDFIRQGIGVIRFINTFGEGEDGEIYFADPGTGPGEGRILKLVQFEETTPYCTTSPNSIGPGAELEILGSTSIPADDMTLVVTQVPDSEFGIFFFGDTQLSAPFYDGLLCISAGQGSGIHRILPPVLSVGNTSTVDINFNSFPADQIAAGSNWNFQFWYRDPGGPLGTGANTSNALEVHFQP